jgi:hypothetical protein
MPFPRDRKEQSGDAQTSALVISRHVNAHPLGLPANTVRHEI